ncbi:MAG: Radical protein [Acidobacteria bacterium]|nr:Radical protein [Acidobacteriota bacterium]
MSDKADLIKRYQYGAQYVTDYEQFRRQVMDKTVVPHQVEIQPPPPGKKICWLECPWCYGLSATDTGDRLPRDRAVEIMRQIAAGGVRKIVFAGYATDPLYCDYLEDLLSIAIDSGQVFGFNTKAIKASDRLLELLATPTIAAKSYLSVSVDAGSNEVFNDAHAVENTKTKLYDRIRSNVEKIAASRAKGGAWFDISATYLINSHNNSPSEVAAFIHDFKNAGANLLRFTFPQLPRDFVPAAGIIPSKKEVSTYTAQLKEAIEKENSDQCAVLLVDADSAHDIFRKPRTVPCFARFIYPTVGFDGWLYHCSQSSSPNFRSMALGNLLTHDFWDLYYSYDTNNIAEFFGGYAQKMATAGCRCDRKEHVVNTGVINSGVFPELAGS